MTDTASPTTQAFHALPSDIQATCLSAVGKAPLSYVETLLLVGRAIEAERERDRWLPIETAPKDGTPVIIAVPTKERDDFIVGEAYFHTEDEEWWWAGTAPGDYYADPISECNHHAPAYWQPLPGIPGEAFVGGEE